MALLFASDQSAQINENQGRNSVVYRAEARHDDSSQTPFTYSLGAGSDPLLSIDATTGVVTLSSNIDYETKNSYSFTVTATSGGVSVSQVITLSVVDAIEGTNAADSLTGTSGDDFVDGLGGLDTVTYSGNIADYRIELIEGGLVRVTDLKTADGNDGVDTLQNIKVIAFADGTATVQGVPSPSGSEFRVNTYTSGAQDESSVAGLDGGGFVVTWSSGNQDGSNHGIYSQRYAADGTASGSEFRVNTYTSSTQQDPSVAGLDGGGFVVTWYSQNQDGSGYGVYAQRYAADGTASGSEFRVNTYTSSSQYQPSVAALDGGGFVVTWSSSGQDGSDYGIYGQRYAADGTALGSEFRVNTYTSSDQEYPSVAALDGGGFIVTWSSRNQDGSSLGIYGQRYAADGTA